MSLREDYDALVEAGNAAAEPTSDENLERFLQQFGIFSVKAQWEPYRTNNIFALSRHDEWQDLVGLVKPGKWQRDELSFSVAMGGFARAKACFFAQVASPDGRRWLVAPSGAFTDYADWRRETPYECWFSVGFTEPMETIPSGLKGVIEGPSIWRRNGERAQEAVDRCTQRARAAVAAICQHGAGCSQEYVRLSGGILFRDGWMYFPELAPKLPEARNKLLLDAIRTLNGD